MIAQDDLRSHKYIASLLKNMLSAISNAASGPFQTIIYNLELSQLNISLPVCHDGRRYCDTV